MLKRVKFKRLILYITDLRGGYYAECRPMLPQTKLTATTVKDAEKEAYRLLRAALLDHLDIIV